MMVDKMMVVDNVDCFINDADHISVFSALVIFLFFSAGDFFTMLTSLLCLFFSTGHQGDVLYTMLTTLLCLFFSTGHIFFYHADHFSVFVFPHWSAQPMVDNVMY